METIADSTRNSGACFRSAKSADLWRAAGRGRFARPRTVLSLGASFCTCSRWWRLPGLAGRTPCLSSDNLPATRWARPTAPIPANGL